MYMHLTTLLYMAWCIIKLTRGPNVQLYINLMNTINYLLNFFKYKNINLNYVNNDLTIII